MAKKKIPQELCLLCAQFPCVCDKPILRDLRGGTDADAPQPEVDPA